MVNWTTHVDALLFKHVLKLHEIKPNYPELEKAMRADGVDATAKAITHRICKIRSTTNTENGDVAPGALTNKPRSTAAGSAKDKKRKANGEVKKVVPDGDHFESADANQDQEAGSEPADEASSKKKQKRTAPKKAAKMKKEVVKDEDAVKDEEQDEVNGAF